jgi:hypothetical protein
VLVFVIVGESKKLNGKNLRILLKTTAICDLQFRAQRRVANSIGKWRKNHGRKRNDKHRRKTDAEN